MAHEFIYQAYKLARHYPPDKTVLENISLSFYPGAKIGVLGIERRRQVVAAEDHGRPRRRVLRRGPPHRRLHRRLPGPGAAARSRQGRQGQRDGRRGRGAGHHRSLQRGHVDVGRPRRRLRQDRQGAGPARGQDRRHRRLEPRTQRRDRHGRAALPARRRRRHGPVRWRAPSCCAVPPAALAPRPAAARRADQPPRRRVGRLARAIPRGLRRHRRGDHPRPLLPRQRGQVDPRAARRQGHPVRGQLLELARAEAGAAGARGAQQRGAQAHARPGTRVGPDGPEGTPGEGQGPPRRLREALQREQGAGSRPVGARDRHPALAAASATR